jgi:quercetin dioxygenase-like cupin family protein
MRGGTIMKGAVWTLFGLATASALILAGQTVSRAQQSDAEAELRAARVGHSVPVEMTNPIVGFRRFEAGNRTYWHSHDGGFILFVQEGRARTQMRGGEVKELGPGEVEYTPPGVEHWHGAAADEPLLQLGVIPLGGGIQWSEEVGDAEYRGTASGSSR